MYKNWSKILLHSLGIVLFISLPILYAPHESISETITHNRFAQRDLLVYSLLVVFVYLHYYIIIPQLYFKKHFIQYGLLLGIGILITCILPIYLMDIFGESHIHEHHHTIENTLREGSKHMGHKKHGPPFLFEFKQNLFVFLVAVLFSLMIRINNRLKYSEEKRSEAELSYLKAQVNPHFLFNTLNSIYALAISGSEQTSDMVLKLSGIMRFVLTEAKKDLVPLDKEIEYIDDYIALQRIRLGETFKLSYTVKGKGNKLEIPPLLLIPIIENAFKHGVNPEENSCILINLEIDVNKLILTVDNNKVKKTSFNNYPGGLGLKNVRDRLKMLYPERHRFVIEEDSREFNVYLEIEL
ncbi:MAG: sensor histidine kinase [Bacteroidia bacterium]